LLRTAFSFFFLHFFVRFTARQPSFLPVSKLQFNRNSAEEELNLQLGTYDCTARRLDPKASKSFATLALASSTRSLAGLVTTNMV
jgi:hypothetical protein